MSAWVAHLKTSPRTEATPEAVVLAPTAAQPQATAGSLSLTETWLEKHDRRLKEWAEEQRELQDSWAEKGKERQKEHEDWFKEFLADGEAQHQQRLAGMARVSTAAPVADPEPLPDIQPHEGRNPDGRPSGGLPAELELAGQSGEADGALTAVEPRRAPDAPETLDTGPVEPSNITPTPGQRGRKRGVNKIDDEQSLNCMLDLLASGSATSIRDAASRVANSMRPNHSKAADNNRLRSKFSTLFGGQPPNGKTWVHVQARIQNRPDLK